MRRVRALRDTPEPHSGRPLSLGRPVVLLIEHRQAVLAGQERLRPGIEEILGDLDPWVLGEVA